MKFKLGLLLGATGGYLFGSGKAQELWQQIKPTSATKPTSRTTPERDVDAIVVDMTTTPVEASMR